MNYDTLNKSQTLSAITRSLRRNFELWNYRETFLPAITRYDGDLDRGTKFVHGDEFYLVKPDITSQILTGLKEVKKHKLFYFSEVLNGGVDGVWQFGAEYIGGAETWMTVEILSSIITALERLEIEDFYIDIGSRKVWEEATEGLEERDKVFEALYHRNFELIDEIPMAEEKKEEIWRLFNYRRETSDYEKLDEILTAVDDDRLYADFGTVRHRDYYDDVTFEVYSPEVGAPLGGGGEYRFRDVDACGFGFNVEYLAEIWPDGNGREVTVIDEDPREGYRKARELVQEEETVEVKPCR